MEAQNGNDGYACIIIALSLMWKISWSTKQSKQRPP